jgi:hypothetical protein
MPVDSLLIERLCPKTHWRVSILNAITSKDLEIRYVIGDDAESIMKVRKSTSVKDISY